MNRNFIKLLRVHHYSKNLFILLPLFFSLKITDLNLLIKASLAFCTFSIIASTIYAFNDYRDFEEDRAHPVKRNRPIASGKISKKETFFFILILLLIGLISSFLISLSMFYLVLFYLFLNIAYTLKLKQIPIIDIFIIAIGFVIRIFIGGVVTSVDISMWIIIMTFLLALFLALAKRRDDLFIIFNNSHIDRKSTNKYNIEFIDSAMIVMVAIIIVAYIMYTISADVIEKFKTDKLYLTTLFVVLGTLKYMHITIVERKSGSPTDIFFKDRFIQLSILGWIIAFGTLIYL